MHGPPEHVFPSDDDGLILADGAQRIVAVDEALARRCDYRARQLTGQSVTMLISTALAPIFSGLDTGIDCADADSSGPARRVLIRCRDASMRPASLRVRTLKASDAPLYLGRVVFDDATPPDLAPAEPATTVATLTRRIAGLSHDLRNGMNTVLGMSRVGSMQADSAERAALAARFQIIERAGSRMIGVLNDLIDFGKLEAGALTLSSQPYDLDALVREVCAEHGPLFEDKPVELRILREPSPLVAQIDDSAVARVLGNLLANALKFSPRHGCVEVELHAAGGSAHIAVDDSGPGIPQADRQRVFAPFVRLDGAPQCGAGLGLAVAGELVAAHGGDIAIESGRSGGARFVVRLPLEGTRAAATAATASGDATG